MAHSPDLRPFLLGGVTGPSLAAPRMATRCHPQLILKMKATEKEPGWGKEGRHPEAAGVAVNFIRKVICKGSFVFFQNSASHADGKSQFNRFFVSTCCTQGVRILLNVYSVPDPVHTVDHSMFSTTLYSRYDY